MSNDRERKKLIWKYFWKRKRQEVWAFIKKAWVPLVFMAWVITGTTFLFYPSETSFLIGLYIFGIGYSILLIVAFGALIHFLSRKFIRWIKSNWEWATNDADYELSRRSRRMPSTFSKKMRGRR